MTNTIMVPTVLPNRVRQMREIRNLSVNQVSSDLMINRNFLCSVENQTNNFSGKTTIRALKYFNGSFNRMYDIQDIFQCSVSEYIENKSQIIIHSSDIDNVTDTDNVITSELEEQKLKFMISNKLQETISLPILQDYTIISKIPDNNSVKYVIEANYISKQQSIVDIDINFSKNEDTKLTNLLLYRGFPECITSQEITFTDDIIYIKDNFVHLDKEYKIPKGKDISNFSMMSKLPINHEGLIIKYDNQSGNPISARFKVIKNEINNLQAVRTLTHYTTEDMHKALNLSQNAYINFEIGNQKISTKIMWALVQFLKVPLECVLNIDEYYDRFCIHEKIVKGKSKDKVILSDELDII